MGILIYVTCASMQEAETIGQALLRQRLVACVNIFSQPVLSLYVWQGEAQRSQEFVLAAKTMDSRFTQVDKVVRELHSYETPCVAALPLAAVDPDFMAWIEQSVQPDQIA